MKANHLLLTLSASFFLFTGCRDKTVWIEDSPFITVTSPTQNQAMEDNDSIRVEALIQPKSAPIVSYHIVMMGEEKEVILNYKTICDCKDKSTVAIDTAFTYDIKKTSNVLLHVSAELEDRTHIRDETRFKLVDTKK
ncbi:hypothetical protein DYBT9623_03195 [Dyadobacter sp. CECT 9623]|uniref:DUF1573 domain-containing protein n=1 Tax=Dyadobacter linearis TaxID=2823330 RepID=A0ABM8USH3_9BACT|nr:hypothetical protein [Dyadobacter sp. CECT 9623]CAG5070650.1 hypothetical protein DYBT9623_03195 [Dyadobacter sp. CECT 9623]